MGGQTSLQGFKDMTLTDITPNRSEFVMTIEVYFQRFLKGSFVDVRFYLWNVDWLRVLIS
jgi:hypothetical protein